MIDIKIMKGETPQIAEHLLPTETSSFANNCHFNHGVISPIFEDKSIGKAFGFKPKTIFQYNNNYWFAWKELVDVIRSPVAQDKHNRIYFTDGKYPKVTSSDIATQGTGNYPANSYRLGIPAPANPVLIERINKPDTNKEDDPTDDETRYYVETYVTRFNEEGPPGPVSTEVTIKYPGSTVDLLLEPIGSQNNNITRRRIYRTASGGGDADYLLVAEIDIAVRNFNDNIPSKYLGPRLETYSYFMPPDDMIGLCQMANGICAGFAGNQIMFSEAYLPYAWPETYKQTTEHKIVGIVPIGTSLIVATEGYPYLFSGVSPSSITNAKLPIIQSCSNRESIVSMDGFVLYASPNGLVSIDGQGNAVVATEQIIEARQWRKQFNPTTIKAWKVDGEYVAIYQDNKGDWSGFIFNHQAMDFRRFCNVFDTAYHDLVSDQLYTIKDNELFIYQGGHLPEKFTWRSRVFQTANPHTSLSCLRIVSKNINLIGFKLFVDGELILNLPAETLTDEVIRLPVATGRKWQFEVSGTAQVDRITLASSMLEIGNE